MRYVLLIVGLVLAAAAVAFAQEPEPAPAPTPTPEATPTVAVTATPTFTDPVDEPSVPPDFAAVQWRTSQSKGSWARKGRLVRGVMLPELGEDFFTWDPIKNQIPNREWRRYGTDRLIRTVLTVIHEFRTEHDSAQRIGIMDLSRTHGGKFGRRVRWPRPRLAPERAGHRHPLPAQGRHRDPADQALTGGSRARPGARRSVRGRRARSRSSSARS